MQLSSFVLTLHTTVDSMSARFAQTLFLLEFAFAYLSATIRGSPTTNSPVSPTMDIGRNEILIATEMTELPEVDVLEMLPPGMDYFGEMILDTDHGQSISLHKDPLIPDQLGIVLTGPASVYYAVGFGHHVMGGSYAIVVDGIDGTVTERVLGHHQEGYLLNPGLSLMANTVHNGIRTVAVVRETTWTDCTGEMELIFARGSTPEFAIHERDASGTSTIHGECSEVDDLDHDVLDDSEDGSIGHIQMVNSSVSFGTVMVLSLVLHAVL